MLSPDQQVVDLQIGWPASCSEFAAVAVASSDCNKTSALQQEDLLGVDKDEDEDEDKDDDENKDKNPGSSSGRRWLVCSATWFAVAAAASDCDNETSVSQHGVDNDEDEDESERDGA